MTSEQRIVSLVPLNWSCPVNYLWTDGCPYAIHPCCP